MRRRVIRLPDYDYRLPGVYLVTCCTCRRERSLSRIDRRGVHLTPLGEIVREHLETLPSHRPLVRPVDWVIMPDHLHLLIEFAGEVAAGLGAVIRDFKAGVSRDANRARPMTRRTIWQRNYWERVVRSAAELAAYRRYFRDNPRRWLARYGEEWS